MSRQTQLLIIASSGSTAARQTHSIANRLPDWRHQLEVQSPAKKQSLLLPLSQPARAPVVLSLAAASQLPWGYHVVCAVSISKATYAHRLLHPLSQPTRAPVALSLMAESQMPWSYRGVCAVSISKATYA